MKETKRIAITAGIPAYGVRKLACALSRGSLLPRSIVPLLLVTALCGNWLVLAINPPGDTRIAFGLVGLTHGQSVYLNVSNIKGTNPPDDGSPASVELSIVDADGLTLARSTERLARGRSAALILNRDSLASRRESRLGVRAIVIVGGINPPDDGTNPPDDIIVASLEVVDNASLRTQYVVPPWVTKGFNPQPEPPATFGK